MALSAFKSTTKRATTTPPSSSSTASSSSSSSKQEKIPNRRSRSVSAVSRTHGSLPSPPSSSNLPASDELFLNKRDNPLYSCSSSSSSLSSPGSETPANCCKDGCESRSRGRSVSRSSGVGSQSSGSRRNEKAAGSLSRVDTGRRRLRSVSREHYGNLETDIEHPYKSTSSLRSKEDNKSTTSMGQRKTSGSVTAIEFDGKEQKRNLQTWTSRQAISESWDASTSCSQARNWEDGISTSSFSEAEEAAVLETFLRDNSLADVGPGEIYETVRSEVRRAVSEIRDDLENAIWRKKPSILTTENIVDIQPEFVNTDKLVSDVTREYVSKLEQTQERARKLRADLAAEEQHEQELSRILNEMIQTPRTSDSRKSHPKRKASIERRRMSRRLAEEAMSYFDECVSISTFDSSDFSSLEDPQPSSVIGIPPTGSSRFFSDEGSTCSVSDFPCGHANFHEELDNQTQCSLSIAGSDLAIGSSCSGSKAANGNHDDLLNYDIPQSGNLQRPFTMAADETYDMRQYIKKFEKGLRREVLEHASVKSSYSRENYDLNAKAESLVFDSLILRNRMESGGLHLCDIRVFS